MKFKRWYAYLDELLNSITHGIGVLLSIAGLVLLVVFASIRPYGDAWKIVSFSIYGFSLILMYTASTLYHAYRNKKVKEFLNLFDHAAIYVLIAGTYTPFTLVSLRGPWGWSIFGVIWGLAIAGVVFKLFFYSDKYRNLSAIIYFLMGWIILIAIRPMLSEVPTGGLLWLLGGCLIYSMGIPFYIKREKRFFHVIWHLFVLGGSITHFFAIFFYVLPHK
ncbi:MAG: PAQR family membrane homeostasis protein TrhA [Bacteroidales bacterium]